MPADTTHFSLAMTLALACAAVETIEQLLYRIAGRDRKRWWSHISIATLLHVTYLALWLLLLRIVPLTTALPLMGLQYVTIAVAAKLLFNEAVDARRWLGIGVILIGFVMVASHMKE